jgi:hypothetical protein
MLACTARLLRTFSIADGLSLLVFVYLLSQAKRWGALSGQFLSGQQLTHVDLVLFTTLSALRSGWVTGELIISELSGLLHASHPNVA